ncbi:MAG: hypothetical protein AB1742_09825 [bacterium]
MHEEKNNPAAAAAAALVLIIAAAALAAPNARPSNVRSKQAAARSALPVVRYALEKYARRHAGVFPPTHMVIGGNSPGDVLIKERCLERYPPNPFSRTHAPIRNHPAEDPSPGDFVYRRSPGSVYTFHLSAKGAGPTEKDRKNSIRR